MFVVKLLTVLIIRILTETVAIDSINKRMESWKDDFVKEITDLTQNNVNELDTIMEHIGLDENMKMEWINFLRESIQESYSHMINEVKIFQNKIIDSIEELLQRSEDLCKQLRITMPQHGVGNLTLAEEKKLLKAQIAEYESKIEERLNVLNNLNKRQAEVCYSLGREPKFLVDTKILPTMDEMYEFASYIEELENEKCEREIKYLETKSKILDIMNVLGIKPSSEIEKTLCSLDNSVFLVTDFNMNWLIEYYESLIRQQNEMFNEISNLREQITSLWQIISEDKIYMNDFMSRHIGNSLDTLIALQNEVKRCEILKAANIEKVIRKMREDIICYWEKCHFSARQRAEFEFLETDLFTEDLLKVHDIELHKMKQYYEENKEILCKLGKRDKIWKQKIELEDKATDPNRLKNRGGTLLKEGRERNALIKKISDLELELLQLAKKYEEKFHRPFLSWDRPLSDIIAETTDEYEKNKKQQLSAKKVQRARTPSPCTSGLMSSGLSGPKKNLFTLTPGNSKKTCLTPAVGTPGLSSASNRKLSPTKLFSGSKKKTPRKEDIGIADKAKIAKNQDSDKTSQQKKIRYSHERKKRLEKIRRLSKMLEVQKKVKAANDSIDYEVFQEEINDRETCRSTLFNRPICKIIITEPTPVKPPRTPS